MSRPLNRRRIFINRKSAKKNLSPPKLESHYEIYNAGKPASYLWKSHKNEEIISEWIKLTLVYILFIISFERFGIMCEETCIIDFIPCFTGILFILAQILMASQIYQFSPIWGISWKVVPTSCFTLKNSTEGSKNAMALLQTDTDDPNPAVVVMCSPSH